MISLILIPGKWLLKCLVITYQSRKWTVHLTDDLTKVHLYLYRAVFVVSVKSSLFKGAHFPSLLVRPCLPYCMLSPYLIRQYCFVKHAVLPLQVQHYMSICIMQVYPCLLFKQGLSVIGCMRTYAYNLAEIDFSLNTQSLSRLTFLYCLNLKISKIKINHFIMNSKQPGTCQFVLKMIQLSTV